MKNILPVRIVACGGRVENAAALLLKQTPQIGLREKNTAKIEGKAFLILDFGREISGGARILTFSDCEKRTVRLRFGESVSETCAEIGEKNAGNDHSNRDFKVELRGYSDMTFGQTGFRFLRVDTEEGSRFSIKSILAACDADEREERGSFECDDEEINKIWRTAAYTLRLCMKNGFFWDGVKRDRLVWIGDLYPESRAAHYVFGDAAETRNSLLFAREERPPARMGGGHARLFALVADHSARRIPFRRRSRFREGAAALSPRADRADLRLRGEKRQNAVSGEFYRLAFRMGGRRAGREKKEELFSGMNFLTRIAVQKAKNLLAAAGEGEGDAAAECGRILSRLAKAPCPVRRQKQIAALGAWAGADVDKEVILRGGEKGLSTFMSYPVLSAMADVGGAEFAYNAMKKYYGGMLALGATTFWEDFDPAWAENAFRIDEMPVPGKKDIHGDFGKACYIGFRHSLCHGWSAGVIPFLAERALGVKIAGAGCASLEIRPELGGLKRVKGRVPTPRGNVTVEHVLQTDGSVKSSVSAPEGVNVRVLS